MSEIFDPVAWINTPRWQASRLGLERMRELLERMGRPQDDLRFVHVAGTNGKGSVCAYLERMLRAAGYRTGLFTSPFIERFEERIRVVGENIAPDELTRAVAVVRPHAEAMEAESGDHPTEFELMCAVALEHFRATECDIVVMEVGLGGRLDATNVIDAPEAAVICRIGLDHTELLGDTLGAVAGEKAGIVKAGAPVVSWPQEPEAMAVIANRAAACGCTLSCPDFAALEVGSVERGVRSFSYRGASFTTRLLGSYQPYNAALALEAAAVLRSRGWRLPDDACTRGIAEAAWPGRFEVVDARPLTIIDGGHNPQGAEALADSLADLLGDAGRGSAVGLSIGGAAKVEGVVGPSAEGEVEAGGAVGPSAEGTARDAGVVFVMGVLADKDYAAMIEAVLPWARAFVAYTPPSPRALSADDLAAALRAAAAHAGNAELAARVRTVPSPACALAAAREQAGVDGVVVAFGTLYAIADLKRALGA